jgi:flagellar motor protein MotB
MALPYAQEDTAETSAIWPVFGDLMACLFGIFVLFFVWAISFQVDLTASLRAEKEARAETNERLRVLESALSVPISQGQITLEGGTIAIRGSVLFPLNSPGLRPEGEALIAALVEPLMDYLSERDEMIMVSGFTDDLTLGPRAGFKDNWELSTERALTVTRQFVRAGMPEERIFAAGFGANHPVAPNTTSETRALNRRVEISPIPRVRRVEP